ncbi:discoidin I [Cavenderia fasciculata]|uniref:Discoidin I n=1 Tax=Cavenderia fasciculata TaxID=261658 RepID=F4PLE0_CACFS|nr:discoidin I [Cavenderia fasciculata]EGG23362.1 discoidin I [Cavenderia fasciculata]|eukprot:XP_004361213.1 discoidin I [Cavenderia fasciculata]
MSLATSIKGISLGSLQSTASTEWAPGFTSHFARLNYERHPSMNGSVTGGSSAWCAKTNDAAQWISASSENLKTFTGIQIQGRADTDCNQFVTSYTLEYSVDGIKFVPFNNGQVFTANTDRNTIVSNIFATPVVARTLILKPKTWNEHISLRWEVFYQPIKQSLVNSGTLAATNLSLLTSNSPPRDRTETVQVVFKNPYPTGVIPQVVAQIKRFDINQSFNARYKVDVSNVTNTGFALTFMTWFDTILYSAEATYVAHAEV